MNGRELNILIVGQDGPIMATLAKQLVLDLSCNITIVDTLEEASVLIASKGYDAVIASADLPDGSGLSLLDDFDRATSAPFIICENNCDAAHLLSLLRRGAADVLTQPIDETQVAAAVERVARQHQRQRTAVQRSKRLRRLTSRVIRDRRELRQRVDLICRDLVQAYRRLAEKIVTPQEPATPDAQ